VPSAPARCDPPRGAPSMELVDVAFGYGGKTVLRSASFRVEPAERIALTGASGAGKTTVLSLLLRFAVAERGRILIDGAPLDGIDADGWRSVVAWLPQRPTLFAGTVRENIVLGRADATGEELRRATREAGVDEFLGRLPRGIDTRIGEGGQGLSVGQAQRVALARLFLRAPRVVLLDEPTAHLDAESAALVTDGIKRLAEGCTTILVTHKPETSHAMDRVLVLADGVVEVAG